VASAFFFAAQKHSLTLAQAFPQAIRERNYSDLSTFARTHLSNTCQFLVVLPFALPWACSPHSAAVLADLRDLRL
jgi:hypothetical protein